MADEPVRSQTDAEFHATTVLALSNVLVEIATLVGLSPDIDEAYPIIDRVRQLVAENARLSAEIERSRQALEDAGRVAAERDEARRHVEQLRAQREQLLQSGRRLRLAWWSARQRALWLRNERDKARDLFLDAHAAASDDLDRVLALEGGLRTRTAERDLLRWLHAEAVWQRDERFTSVVHQCCEDVEALRDKLGEQVDATDLTREVEASAEVAPHGPDDHEWVPCKNCPNPSQPCACAGGVCCEAEFHDAVLSARGETGTEAPLCEKCGKFPVWHADRPSHYTGHFCARCCGECHDMSDESSTHMCVIDRWTSAGTEASE